MSMKIDEAIKFAEHAQTMTDIPEVKEFYAMAEKALRIQNQVNWISVKDRLPEPDVKTIGRIETEKVIAWDGNRLVFGNFTIYRHDNSFEFYGADADGTYCFWKVTHWMPLPEPPERDGE